MPHVRDYHYATDDWIWRLLERKPAKVAAVAIANKMARTIWALLKTCQSYRAAL